MNIAPNKKSGPKAALRFPSLIQLYLSPIQKWDTTAQTISAIIAPRCSHSGNFSLLTAKHQQFDNRGTLAPSQLPNLSSRPKRSASERSGGTLSLPAPPQAARPIHNLKGAPLQFRARCEIRVGFLTLRFQTSPTCHPERSRGTLCSLAPSQATNSESFPSEIKCILKIR